jgi:hypothetical protein
METLEQKKRRLFGKKYLISYLQELNKIIVNKVSQSDLLSIEETDEILKYKFSSNSTTSFKILFNNKEDFKKIINKYIEIDNNKYYVFTSYWFDCGALKINILSDFNFDFYFDDEHSGIISFIREDIMQKIILDYYEEGDCKFLDIEIYPPLPQGLFAAPLPQAVFRLPQVSPPVVRKPGSRRAR